MAVALTKICKHSCHLKPFLVFLVGYAVVTLSQRHSRTTLRLIQIVLHEEPLLLVIVITNPLLSKYMILGLLVVTQFDFDCLSFLLKVLITIAFSDQSIGSMHLWKYRREVTTT